MGHVTYFLKFWNPLHISGTVEAILQTWHTNWPLAVLSKKCKIRSKWSWWGHV